MFDKPTKTRSVFRKQVLTKAAMAYILYMQGKTCIVLGIEKIPQ